MSEPPTAAFVALATAALDGARIDVDKRVVLRAPRGWSVFGIRDPSLAGDAALYFNGRDAPIVDGGRTCVGRARWTGGAWVADDTPVFADGAYAAAGSVGLVGGAERMFYSPDTAAGFADAIRAPGGRWARRGDDLILMPEQFGCRRMGLPFVTADAGRWLMVFEGVRRGYGIFGAASSDGLTWEPLRGGEPLYTPARGAWDSFGQANPSLHVHEGTYVIVYNGEAARHSWDLGVLAATDPEAGAWRALDEPLVRRGPSGTWDAGRVEGGRPWRGPSGLGLLYFGLPGEDSYRDGAIGFARLVT